MRIPTLMSAALILGAAALPALAETRCDTPEADRRPVEELKTELTAKGWDIRNVKIEDGCYEVYGHDADGKRVEIFFDPATFEAVGSDD